MRLSTTTRPHEQSGTVRASHRSNGRNGKDLTRRIRKSALPFALPDLDEMEVREIRETLRSGWLTTGPKTQQFQDEFARTVGAKHAVAVNSCTAALHLALEAIGLQPGDEVVTTPYTFAATAEVIRYFDAHPVFVDVDPDTVNLNVDSLETVVTNRTRAIVPVHVGGLPAELDRIHRIASKYGLAVIEDAAHAFPAKLNGKMIGQHSTATCFSFYATKTITTGEGGMICTNDTAVAQRCRMMATHGITRDAWRRTVNSDSTWHYDIVERGFKYNMSDLAASVGIAQLRKVDRMWQRRREIAASYDATFCMFPELYRPTDSAHGQHAWHLYMLRLNRGRLAIDRDRFIKELEQRKIGCSVHFIPLHLHPYYRETYGYRPDDFPVATREYEREISLPIYSKMTDKDVHSVIAAVVDIVRRFRR